MVGIQGIHPEFGVRDVIDEVVCTVWPLKLEKELDIIRK